MWYQKLNQPPIRVSTELFPLDKGSWTAVRDRPFHYYKIRPLVESLTVWNDLPALYSHVARSLDSAPSHTATLYSENRIELVSSSEIGRGGLSLGNGHKAELT